MFLSPQKNMIFNTLIYSWLRYFLYYDTCRIILGDNPGSCMLVVFELMLLRKEKNTLEERYLYPPVHFKIYEEEIK